MKVGIIGDGIAGRTLYRLLKSQFVPTDLFGEHKRTRCGVRPCGFGTSAACVDFVRRLGILPEQYVLGRDHCITIGGRRIAGELYSIDKPALLKALSTDVRCDAPALADYDLLVDATGSRRAIAPRVSGVAEKTAAAYQFRAQVDTRPLPAFDPIRGGYLWTIPLTDREAHIGGASTLLPPTAVEKLVRNYLRERQTGKLVCSCSETLRVSGPLFPLVSGNVVTVGESAGLVVPFGAAGIHTALESAVILAGHIAAGSLAGYETAIRKRFGSFTAARKIVDGVDAGHFAVTGLATAYRALRYQGLRPTIPDLFDVRRKLLAASR